MDETSSFLDKMMGHLHATSNTFPTKGKGTKTFNARKRTSTMNPEISLQFVMKGFDKFPTKEHSIKYYTGYPKDLGPSRVIHFTSEREFVQLLHQGHPIAVAFTIKCNYAKHLDKVFEEVAAEFYPHVKFMRVECPKYPGFCISRQRKDYPFIEIFHNPVQAANQGKVADPNITKYSVKVLPFNYDTSPCGFREFFKRHGIHSSSSNSN